MTETPITRITCSISTSTYTYVEDSVFMKLGIIFVNTNSHGFINLSCTCTVRTMQQGMDQ